MSLILVINGEVFILMTIIIIFSPFLQYTFLQTFFFKVLLEILLRACFEYPL